MKKVLILLIVIIVGLSAYLLLKKPSGPSGKEILKRDRALPNHPVRSLKSWEKLNKENPEKFSGAFNPSNHGGTASFVGPFRVEVAISGKIIGVYLDNQINGPTLPKNTGDFKIEFPESGEKADLTIFDNGLLVGIKRKPQELPVQFILKGKIAGKSFELTDVLKTYRSKKIIKEGKRND